MDDHKKKEMLKKTFNAVSTGYDGRALRFFLKSANLMADLLGLRGDERVLDVATGTGNAALALAERLPEGTVLGVDFAAGMLEQARRKATARGIVNTEFWEMDIQALELPVGEFDVAVCTFGIFFVEDMTTQLQQIAKFVKPGGKIAISGFRGKSFSPLSDLMFDRLAGYGVDKPRTTWKRIAQESACQELFESAGLTGIRTQRSDVGYWLADADQWWDIVWNAGFRELVNQLAPGDQEQFRREHLQEVAALQTEKGIWLEVNVLFTLGIKP